MGGGGGEGGFFQEEEWAGVIIVVIALSFGEGWGGFVGVKRFRCFNFEGVVGGRLIP